MSDWKNIVDELPPATSSKVPVWMEDQEGRILEGGYAESLCDAGEDATGYWYDDAGNPIPAPVRWMRRN